MKIHLTKPTVVGHGFNGARRYPIVWETGDWESIGEWQNVGGAVNGYCYLNFRHASSGKTDSLKSHQVEELKKIGLVH